MTRSFSERTRLISFLREHGVNAVFHYVPLHSSPAGRKYARTHGPLTVTDRVSDCILRLPLYYGMEESETEYVIETINHFYNQQDILK